MPPKAWGPREREGWNALWECVRPKHCYRKTCKYKYNWYFWYMTCGMGVAIHNRVHKQWDPRYGHSHPAVGIKKQTQVWSQPYNKKSHITSHSNPQRTRNLDFIRQNPRSCAPSWPEQSTNLSMWICELKSNMQENHLITSQWLMSLTDTRNHQ